MVSDRSMEQNKIRSTPLDRLQDNWIRIKKRISRFKRFGFLRHAVAGLLSLTGIAMVACLAYTLFVFSFIITILSNFLGDISGAAAGIIGLVTIGSALIWYTVMIPIKIFKFSNHVFSNYLQKQENKCHDMEYLLLLAHKPALLSNDVIDTRSSVLAQPYEVAPLRSST